MAGRPKRQESPPQGDNSGAETAMIHCFPVVCEETLITALTVTLCNSKIKVDAFFGVDAKLFNRETLRCPGFACSVRPVKTIFIICHSIEVCERPAPPGPNAMF